jgi:lactate dehydrogenase-like 2-hydroxyacid dehydrogenase
MFKGDYTIRAVDSELWDAIQAENEPQSTASSTGSGTRRSLFSTRAETLAQLPKLKLIAVAATGTDIVDKLYCRQNGITVVNIRNYAFNTVPEHVFAFIFACDET